MKYKIFGKNLAIVKRINLISDLTSKEKSAESSKKKPYHLEITWTYYQIDESDGASGEVIGIIGA